MKYIIISFIVCPLLLLGERFKIVSYTYDPLDNYNYLLISDAKKRTTHFYRIDSDKLYLNGNDLDISDIIFKYLPYVSDDKKS